ncbi:HNH nuclease [uncultured Caudovirales phage]|uniref:HNH nuclease n=1 Tax=uncultured Caudovirales phage TaxID=2100421 RepID=A0A6J5S9K2_9CAUD|nr:HNH nuclease [uncultured Caudovirales phage]CAB4205560.1 HNH nuclease [uncultured Caudovirales phage]CAB4221617.1 HNH nuclease [uncultured Caudovirales phage]
MKANKISFGQSLLHEIFDYKDGELYRKNGKIAGGLHRTGYRNIRVNGILYPSHRLIWIYHNGAIDENMQMDHINGIKDDNHIENLRLVTAQQNCFNRSRLTAKGYSWNKDSQKWHASIFVNNKLKFLGLFTEEKAARNAYLVSCKKYHGKYANNELGV